MEYYIAIKSEAYSGHIVTWKNIYKWKDTNGLQSNVHTGSKHIQSVIFSFS